MTDANEENHGNAGGAKPTEELHPLLQEYEDRLDGRYPNHSNPNDTDSGIYNKHMQHVRWFDDWLDEHDLEPSMITPRTAKDIGQDLQRQYSALHSAARYREIYNIYDYFVRKIQTLDENPLIPWYDDRKGEFGMTENETEQEKHLDKNESYALNQEEVRQMEQHVPEPRLRNQLLIRLSWQSGLRQGEIQRLEIERHLDRKNRLVTITSDISKSSYKREIPYQPSLDGLLRRWLNDGYRNRYKYAHESPYLFLSNRNTWLSADAINDAVKNAAYNAGLNRKLYEDGGGRERHKITHHNLRVGYGTYLAQETDMKIKRVSHLLGHE